jgi:hypothetical protein
MIIGDAACLAASGQPVRAGWCCVMRQDDGRSRHATKEEIMLQRLFSFVCI